MKRLIGVFAVALLFAQFVVVAGPADGAAAQDLVRWSLRHSWLPDDLMLPYVVAQEKGFYAEEGLYIDNIVGDGGATAAMLVATGRVELGTGESPHVLKARAQGMNIVSIFGGLQTVQGTVAVLKDSGIETVEDLRGKRIGGNSSSSAYSLLIAGLAKNGMSANDIIFVDLPGAANNTALMTGQVDAIQAFVANQPIDIEARGFELRLITYEQMGVRSQSTSVFVREDFLAANRDLLEGFIRATIRGVKYAVENPEEAADIMVKVFPDLDRSIILAKWLRGREFFFSDFTRVHGLGWQDLGVWEGTQNILLDSGEMLMRVNAAEGFTNVLLESIPLEERLHEPTFQFEYVQY